MVDDSPLQRWEEACGDYRNHPFAPTSKEDFMVAITAALTHAEDDHRLSLPDALQACSLAHACSRKDFLLSHVERIYLSAAVMPMVQTIDDPRDLQMQFHNQMWNRARAGLRQQHYPAAVEILLMVTGRLLETAKLEHTRFLLDKTEPYLTPGPNELHFNAIHRDLSRRRHPSSPSRPST